MDEKNKTHQAQSDPFNYFDLIIPLKDGSLKTTPSLSADTQKTKGKTLYTTENRLRRRVIFCIPAELLITRYYISISPAKIDLF